MSARTNRELLLSNYLLRVATRIDGLQTVEQTGTLIGVSSAASFQPAF